jgi:hypothetical protein
MGDGVLLTRSEWASAYEAGDLVKLLRYTHRPARPLDRHYLLLFIVRLTYKHRTDPEMRALCRRYSEMHLDEFPMMAAHLRGTVGGFMPAVPTFRNYATVLTEDGEYEKAIEVCRLAIKYKIDEVISDGTQSGYAGRIARITKKMERAAQKSTPGGITHRAHPQGR